MSSFRKESLFVIAVLALAMLFWHQTYLIPEDATQFPKLLIILIVGLALAMQWQAWKNTKKKQEVAEEASPVNWKRLSCFAGVLLTYVFTVQPLGYFVVTPLFICIAGIVFKALRPVWAVVVAVLFSSFIYALFVGFLHLPVPLGLLENILGG